MSKHILNLCIAVFFLTLSLVFILGGMRIEKTLNQYEENMAIQKEVYEDMKSSFVRRCFSVWSEGIVLRGRYVST